MATETLPGIELSEAYIANAIEAWTSARKNALAGGHYVVYRDPSGIFVKHEPDGRRFEVIFHPGQPKETHMQVVRELPTADES